MDKIIAMGNALVDVLGHIGDDSALRDMGLPKGSMQLIDERRFEVVSARIGAFNPSRATGGSAANSALALAHLGREAGFIGKVGGDEYGRFYTDTLLAAGVRPYFSHTAMPTGVASTFISPDGQRTFATFLGAAATLGPDDIGAEMLQGYKYLYLEGYLVQNHALVEKAVGLAKSLGMKICLDMASYNIVEADRDFFTRLVGDSIDIVFANEEESRAFTGHDPEESLGEIAASCDTVIIKLGAEGSIAQSKSIGGGRARCKAGRVARVVDTTAAGDFFTAGFMYALTAGCPLEACLRAGTLLSTEVIQVTGTALPEATWQKLRTGIANICDQQ